MSNEYKTQRDLIITAMTTGLTGLTVYYRIPNPDDTYPCVCLWRTGSENRVQGKAIYTSAYKYQFAVIYKITRDSLEPSNSEYDTAIDNAFNKIESLLALLKANTTIGSKADITEISLNVEPSLGDYLIIAECEIKIYESAVNTLK